LHIQQQIVRIVRCEKSVRELVANCLLMHVVSADRPQMEIVWEQLLGCYQRSNADQAFCEEYRSVSMYALIYLTRRHSICSTLHEAGKNVSLQPVIGHLVCVQKK